MTSLAICLCFCSCFPCLIFDLPQARRPRATWNLDSHSEKISPPHQLGLVTFVLSSRNSKVRNPKQLLGKIYNQLYCSRLVIHEQIVSVLCDFVMTWCRPPAVLHAARSARHTIHDTDILTQEEKGCQLSTPMIQFHDSALRSLWRF